MNTNHLFVLIAITAIIFVICPAGAEENAVLSDGVENKLITITSSGDGSYYVGEEILFSGNNTESAYTYMFITGPNLNPNGQKVSEPDKAAVTGDEDTFAIATVAGGGTWKYALDTNGMDFDPGTYTIYAVTEPKNKGDLPNKKYDTVSIVIKRPFITAKVSEPVIKSGEDLVITGTAEGNPTSVAIWVLGFDYWNGAKNASAITVAPEDDASFEYIIKGEETANMDAGEYFVIVQHSMYNNKLDIITEQGSDGDTVYVKERDSSTSNPLFIIRGSSALRGADAAEALIEGINLADIDDTYAKVTFQVEENEDKQSENIQPEVEQPENNPENPAPGPFEAFMNFLSGILG